MVTINEIAGAYSLGFSIGYFKVQDIVDWADKTIENSENPKHSLIELSLCKEKHTLDILKILSELYGKHINPESYNLVTGLIATDYKNGNIVNDRAAVRYLDKLGYILDEGHWPELMKNSTSPEDRKKIELKLQTFLSQFEPFAKEWIENGPII